jgi:hypothetical protein
VNGYVPQAPQAVRPMNLCRMLLTRPFRHETAKGADLARLLSCGKAQLRLFRRGSLNDDVGNDLRGVAFIDPLAYRVFAAWPIDERRSYPASTRNTKPPPFWR